MKPTIINTNILFRYSLTPFNQKITKIVQHHMARKTTDLTKVNLLLLICFPSLHYFSVLDSFLLLSEPVNQLNSRIKMTTNKDCTAFDRKSNELCSI
ncbi:hypothetical protein SAMN05216352_106216 [Alteribacillus bidgolensis]|uniref:Uncharacterized protein n=1 Tax=Alteribacillus bidgolensis TaxID=930129 RepID=A0A1G8JJC7_9BACI|nr:hypothetical protein SAMN05216352_106216 [Alteribacillus bidgolensis]